MGAYLIFGKESRVPENVDSAGPLAEFVKAEFGLYEVTYVELERMKTVAEHLGIPRNVWPDYIGVDDDNARFVSGEKLEEKNCQLKSALLGLSERDLAEDHNLVEVFRALQQDRVMCIDH